jgi:uncharacterized protein
MHFKFSGYTIALIIIVSLIAILVFMLLFSEPKPARKLPALTESPPPEMKEPIFRKDGELRFIQRKTRRVIFNAAIEVALTPVAQEQGLMYRKSMPDSVGMLFVFNVSEPLAFWMRNTIIPLDIIYTDSTKQIVKIISNAKPYSEEQLLSVKPAMYVVEMNAGFADKYGLHEGDFIDFSY